MKRTKFDTTRSYTIGEHYHPAMKIEAEKEAAEYLETLVQYSIERYGQSHEEATRIHRSFIAYFAGYYDHETRVRVERLFSCSHPVFGSAGNGAPSAEEAFGMGAAAAKP